MCRECVRVCVVYECMCVYASVGNIPLELNNMGLEKKKKNQAKLSPLNKSLAMGRSQGTHSFWQQVCVSFTHIILAGECNVSFFFFLFVVILLSSWKFHTGINRSNISGLGSHPRLQNEDVHLQNEEMPLGMQTLGWFS